MDQIALTINGRAYEMTCDEGHEAHLQRLAQYVDEKMRDLIASVGSVGEARLLVMASLLIADELFDSHAEIRSLTARESGGEPDSGEVGQSAAAADALNSCAQRIEAIANRLGGT